MSRAQFLFEKNRRKDKTQKIECSKDKDIPIYRDEFWTSRQRDCHSIHEISYRACYKPQLPRYFIHKHAQAGSVIFDPFLGRGTTLIEARLCNCEVVGSDINPLSVKMSKPRLCPPTLGQISQRLLEIDFKQQNKSAFEREDLLAFYHPDTLHELETWRKYFKKRREEKTSDFVDEWLEMVAISRLSGHSSGFFSVYTLPPNQAVSVDRQLKINAQRKQQPDYRDTRELILKKSKSLLRNVLPPDYTRKDAKIFTASADKLDDIVNESVDLIITSPPFLNTVDYLLDNWLRMWFANIKIDKQKFWQVSSLEKWTAIMCDVFAELRRILKPGGFIAFEVGEVRKASLKLDEEILKVGNNVGLTAQYILINSQQFTKTSNCWGVKNNKAGTNSNRVVVFAKK